MHPSAATLSSLIRRTGRNRALHLSWMAFFLAFLVWFDFAPFSSTIGHHLHLTKAQLTTIGLAARNAILIVEFAQSLVAQGRPLLEAAVEASKMRLRPILMTTFAFMLGVLPLAIASGAGAGAQNSIGIGVLGGMASSAVIGIFLVPVFYVAVLKAVELLTKRKGKPA